MKILLLGFNIQENIFPLGLAYLKGYTSDADIEVKEFSYGKRFSYDVNSTIEQRVMAYILLKKPDVVGFTGYIWSISVMKNIACAIRKINPAIKFIIGGCEADKNSLDSFDYVIYGEGESAFGELVQHFLGKKKIEDVHNIFYKKDGEIVVNPEKYIENLDEIPFPYKQKFKNKYPVVKLETSRGCIYSCKYCNYATRKKRI